MADEGADVMLSDELDWEPMRLVPPDPWTGHLSFAFWLIKTQRPRTFVELGTHSGNSYFAFCQAMASLNPTGRAFAVDTWVGDEHAGGYDEAVFADVTRFNGQHFRQFSTLMRTTFDDARQYFPDGAIDLLHIDGMHTYEAVRHDFEVWKSSLSARAVVVFHDTNVRERDFGVWRLWRELTAEYPSFEFDHSNGLGVLGFGAEQPPKLQALFALAQAAPAAGAFRRRLATRGEAFQRQVRVIELGLQLQEAKRHSEAAAADFQARMPEIASRDQAASARIDALTAELDLRVALLETTRGVIENKDAMVTALHSLVAARSQVVDVRDRMIDERDAAAEQLLERLRHQEFLTREERRLRDEMQQGYENAIAVINADRAALRQGVQGFWQQATDIYVNSISWKVTRPLRIATRLFRGQDPRRSILPPPAIVPPSAAPGTPPPIDVPIEASDAAVSARLKQAMRALLSARLDAFLAGPETLRLPHADSPAISIILVLYNQAELTFGCLSSIAETLVDGPSAEVIIVDNCSTDRTQALLRRISGATIVRNSANLHFLKAVNLAAAKVGGRNILLLNNDAQLLAGSVASALRTLESGTRIGAVGGRIILPDGTLQEAGSIIWRDGACSGYARGQEPTSPDVMFQRDVDYCSGAFLLTPSELFRKLGGFDERFSPAYYEETDYCVRLWESDYRVVYDPDATIVHYEFGSASTNDEALRQQTLSHEIFVSRHRDWLSRQFPASPLNMLAARTARSAAPRILVIEDRVPKVELGTGYPRSNRLVHELIDTGAQVAFFPMFRHEETWHGVRRALDKRIEVLISAEASELYNYLIARRNHFDAILVCRPPNMEDFVKAVGPERSLLGRAKILYDAEALFVSRTIKQRDMDGQPFSEVERHRLLATEVSLTRLAAAVISVSEAEKQVLEDYGARQVYLLGHALEDQPLSTGYLERDQIVFLGAIQQDDSPNADALRWFSSEILPPLRQDLGRNDFRLTVIGQNKAPTIDALDGKTLDLLGMVDELAPALARARVMAVPTRFAAGIPHKVHQAAMLGIPMVVTPLIASQLGWTADVDLLVADTAREFADACAKLYGDVGLWEKVRRSALTRARQDCAPEAFAAKVRDIVTSIPIVHYQPEPDDGISGVSEQTPEPPKEAQEPNTSRPEESDFSVAVPFTYVPLVTAPRIGVVCHLFHLEIAREVLFYLHKIPVAADLFISTDTTDKQMELRKVFQSWTNGRVEIRVTPNRGRDVAPKLVGFADVYKDLDLVLHLHSKVSTHAAFLEPWRSYIFETLLGSPQIVRSIFDAFARLPDLGMVAPQHYLSVRRWLGWNGNFEAAKLLAARMGLRLSAKRALDFPSGSMFWARPAALQPLLDLELSFEDFPVEDSQQDHTPAHAIERLFFYSCEASGHTWLKVSQPAISLDTSTIVEISSPATLSRFVADYGIALSGPANIMTRDDPAPLVTRIPAGLRSRLAARSMT